ncbi:lysozyme inhibitor LprI family protein [Chromobacterium violaceum]|uniref:lysozyme inhibitor LprI family protein n=1 Tax=Chromobacterium violaceum TaxID=536 RepID=UPI00111C2DC9|nr:hypothetical protein [Chromobacterium violaceum]MBX9266431.1 hypothetical protein [Chromobacterium violaceum]QRO32457.1 hypothetical protein I6K04_18505 [Chromobacterium violaceum]QRQ17742.1 hypothetical protein I6K03_04220 [Chromobacterium violaceum]
MLLRQRLITLAPLLALVYASANAAPPLERISEMIRNNPGLRSSDAGLNQLYRTLRASNQAPPALQMTQRNWLRLRIRCDSIACLLDQYQARNAQLARQLAALPCSVKTSQLIHGWESADNSGHFQQFALDEDRAFNSWLHEYPYLSGARWSYDPSGCRLKIHSTRHEGMDFNYTVVMTSHSRLWLLDTHGHTVGNYEQIQ